ncbi:MAG: 50S ribosomal protein L21 [Chloroflexota bacterium]
MYAVVTTGGKQYRVEAGSELVMERLAADAGASVTFDRVLLVGDGEAVTIGTPTVDGASVSGTILGDELGPKLIIFKFKQKATYRRTRGHRQHLVRVRIDEINASGKKAKAGKAATGKAEAGKAEADKAGADAPAKAAATKKPARARATTSSSAKADAPAKPATRRRSPARKAGSKE